MLQFVASFFLCTPLALLMKIIFKLCKQHYLAYKYCSELVLLSLKGAQLCLIQWNLSELTPE